MKEEYVNLIIVYVIITFSIGLLVSLGITSIIRENNLNQCCKDLGFSEYSRLTEDYNVGGCFDMEGNIHYVKTKCSGFLWDNKCSMKEISVGDVRVKK